MPPLERQLLDPLKQMRHKQASDAKSLAAQTIHRAGVFKEQAKTRAAEVVEKQANAERLKTPPPSVDTTGTRTHPDPNQTPTVDPEILPEAGETIEKLHTPEGDVAEISLDYTLSEEREGDNISGNKELKDEGDLEDASNSKRPKGPLPPPHQNERTPTFSTHQPKNRA